MFILGKAYLNGGFGLTKNKDTAKSYFIDAVKNGNTEAEEYLKVLDAESK